MSGALSDFGWTRFWVPREGHLILDDDGFLADPEGKLGRFRNPDALPVESVLSHRCVVLLGEPGIGKSTELERVNRQGASAPAAARAHPQCIGRPGKAAPRSTLDRLQQKLHGHDPRVEFLWDKRVDGKSGVHWQPKDESSLSTFVKSHLEDDLRGRAIILNREVEIRRGLGKEIRQGQETDIQVDAIARNPRSGEMHRVSVIIEVKGSWNNKLKSAMKEQLVDRYLSGSACLHGLYLVGWFACDAWDDGDYRKGDTPKWTLQEANANFLEQAAALSQRGSLIRSFVLDAELR